jgi:basic amino acid/polyamine antiporter, APA family
VEFETIDALRNATIATFVPLRRVLGLWSVVAFGVTNEIAAGLFFVSTQVQATAPGVGNFVPWLMLAGGALTGLTVIAYRFFFAAGLIGAGGEYVIIRGALGRQSAFLATLLTWFGMTGALGTLAYVAPKFLANACASLGLAQAAQWLDSAAGTLLCGLVLLWSVWLVHVRGVRLAAALAVAAMIFVLIVCAIVVVYGFATTPAHFESAMLGRLHLAASQVRAAAPVHAQRLGTALWSALPILFFGYLGLSTATQTGGEAIDPRRSLSQGVLIAVCIVTCVYTLFTFAIYHAVPWQDIAGLAALNRTTYTTSVGLLGLVMPPWLSSLMNVFVAIVVVKTFLPLFLAQSRWIYAWAQDEVLPSIFARTHARFQTPVLALTLSALLGSFALLESMWTGYVFGVSLRVLSVMVVFFLIGLGLLRYDRPAPLWRAALGIVIMVFSVWFSVSLVTTSAHQALWLQPGAQAAIVALLGAVAYRAISRA